MSQLIHIERVFATRTRAEAWFDSLRPTAWPYVWCVEDPERRRWKVVALVEEQPWRAVS